MRLDQLSHQLRALEAAGLLRTPDDQLVADQMQREFGSRFVDLSSNDTLNLGRKGLGSESLLAEGLERRAPEDQDSAHARQAADVSRGTSLPQPQPHNGNPPPEAPAPPLDVPGSQTSSSPRAGRPPQAAQPSQAAQRSQPAPPLQASQSLQVAWSSQVASPGPDGSNQSDQGPDVSRGTSGVPPSSGPAHSSDPAHSPAPPRAASPVVEQQFPGASAGRLGADSLSAQTDGNARGSLSPERGSGEASDVSRGTSRGALGSFPAPGSGASRLIFGSKREHLALERAVAQWVRMPAALHFSSGYAANVGALGALLSPGDAVFSDALNHASLIDGIRLSRARATVVPHLDRAALRQGLIEAQAAPARWVIVEGYYSMDGDGPDLHALRALCDEQDAYLYVDEAHSLGVFGPSGAGRCQEAGIQADVLLAALGKAVGSHGALVCGSEELRAFLWNQARAFVFSTAPSPLQAHSAFTQVERCRSADAERARLQESSAWLRGALKSDGFNLGHGGFGPILSVHLDSPEQALAFAQALRKAGILAQAIRPPTVATSRVRLTVHEGLSGEQLGQVVEACRAARLSWGGKP